MDVMISLSKNGAGPPGSAASVMDAPPLYCGLPGRFFGPRHYRSCERAHRYDPTGLFHSGLSLDD
jgi:hypothetical protein